MSTMIKSSSGFLYREENFGDISLMWDISPNVNNRIVFNDNSITLLPGDERLELLMTVPKENGYVIQCDIDYNPSAVNEKGGFMFKSVTDNIIELEACGDDAVKFRYCKLIIDEKGMLDAKSSIDGDLWYEHGNTKMVDMNKMGFYLGNNTVNDSIEIKDFIIYKNANVFFNNINSNNYVKIFDSNDNEITDKFIIKKKNSQVCIDGTNIIYPIDLKIGIYDKDTNEELYKEELAEVYGGDIYEYKYNVDFYIDDNLLDNTTYNLGTIRGTQTFSLRIANNDTSDLVDKKLFISYYSIYNPGYKLAKISKGDGFKKELIVTIPSGDYRDFTLKVERDVDIYNLENEYYFNINLE